LIVSGHDVGVSFGLAGHDLAMMAVLADTDVDFQRA
jgi:hypothetical protein